MTNTVAVAEAALTYIETHLHDRLTLAQIAQSTHYSKFYLHRLFTETVGMTLGAYVQRRQLSEAAKKLVFSENPLLDIALSCGYDSQQAFSTAFKAMYKLPPAAYRHKGCYYPLQLPLVLSAQPLQAGQQEMRRATLDDLSDWMALVRLVVDGYPVLDEEECRTALAAHIRVGQTLVLYEGTQLVAALAFSSEPAHIDFFGVHPQWRRAGVAQRCFQALQETHLPAQVISMTSYRAGDKADNGQRAMLKALGFAEREWLVEYGYPTQRFEWRPCQEVVRRG